MQLSFVTNEAVDWCAGSSRVRLRASRAASRIRRRILLLWVSWQHVSTQQLGKLVVVDCACLVRIERIEHAVCNHFSNATRSEECSEVSPFDVPSLRMVDVAKAFSWSLEPLRSFHADKLAQRTDLLLPHGNSLRRKPTFV